MVFEGAHPEAVWLVPAVRVPLYYFDDTMLREQLIIYKAPDTFIIPGGACPRIFKLVAR